MFGSSSVNVTDQPLGIQIILVHLFIVYNKARHIVSAAHVAGEFGPVKLLFNGQVFPPRAYAHAQVNAGTLGKPVQPALKHLKDRLI